jgi:hypothetical protein
MKATLDRIELIFVTFVTLPWNKYGLLKMFISYTATCTKHKAHEKYLTKAYVYEINFKKLSILFSSFL